MYGVGMRKNLLSPTLSSKGVEGDKPVSLGAYSVVKLELLRTARMAHEKAQEFFLSGSLASFAHFRGEFFELGFTRGGSIQ